MCGISGLLGRPDRAAVERMMNSMVLRGPDDSGLYEDKDAVLGMRRLSVLDLSIAGHQPMSRAGGKLWIVHNGEVYNFRELRRGLEGRGHRFRSSTDTEVILALYEEMGAECVTRLRGMFAFGVLDRRNGEPVLFLARDHFGIKPLIYASNPGQLVFASDLPAMLASGLVETGIDQASLMQFLIHGHIVQPKTIFKGVSVLPAGHAMTARLGGEPRVWRYWDLDYERCAALGWNMSFEDQAAHLRMLLVAAAQSQMVGDVPVGAFLSGGGDSCSLVSLMMRASGRPIHTYAIGYSDVVTSFDESENARKSAEHLGSIHTSVSVTGREVAETLPWRAERLGQPTIDGVNMYFASRAARSGVTVALAGMGVDEVFGGYPWCVDLQRSWKTPDSWRRVLGSALGRTGAWKVLRRSGLQETWELRSLRRDHASNYMVFHMIRSPSEALRLAGAGRIEEGEVFAYMKEDDAGVADVVSRVSRLDMKHYLCSQLLRDSDAASMACSLEMRVPFLDLDVVEFGFGLPGSSKLGPSENGRAAVGKRVFIHAVNDLIPEWTHLEPKKGFCMPFAEWIRGPLRPLVHDVISDGTFRSTGLLDPREMDRVWGRFLSGQDERWARIWTVLMLGLWWRGLRIGARAPVRPLDKSRVATAVADVDVRG
jgi:asparagine synthase (glutamine-hydrolysing)